MKQIQKGAIGVLIAVISLVASPFAQSALIDRGNGMIYDSEQDLTWVQDVTLVKTSGYDADGGLTWDEAVAWATGLNYGGFDDWRLPNMDERTNSSELDTLFEQSLVSEGPFGFPPRHVEPGPFTGFDADTQFELNRSVFWLNQETLLFGTEFAFVYSFGDRHTLLNPNFGAIAWAVRDGDVGQPAPSPVPVPAALWLLGSALIGLSAIGRRKLDHA